jgi:hypothetical protein
MNGMAPKQVRLVVVVNGHPTPVESNVHQPTSALIREALRLAGDAGQKADDYELTDQAGNVLPQDRKVGENGIADGATLYLGVAEGTGG